MELLADDKGKSKPEALSVAVILACLNEAPSIAGPVSGFRQALPVARIVVCDNGSTETTEAAAARRGRGSSGGAAWRGPCRRQSLLQLALRRDVSRRFQGCLLLQPCFPPPFAQGVPALPRGFETELSVRAPVQHLPVAELPVSCGRRPEGW